MAEAGLRFTIRKAHVTIRSSLTCRVIDSPTEQEQNDGMDAFWELDWRAYPAAAITMAGLILAVHGGAVMVRGFLAPLDRPGKNLRTVRAMRMCLQGLSLAAVAFGWWMQWPAMFWAGVIVGFEETIETSIVAWALREEYEHSRDGRAW